MSDMPPPPPYGPPPHPPHAIKPKWYRRGWVIGVGAGVLGLILGAAIAAPEDSSAATARTGSDSDTPATVTVTAPAAAAETVTEPAPAPTTKTVTKTVRETVTAEPPKPTPPPGPKRRFGDGTWLVNKDIAPGTYRTTDAHDCYWQRLSGLSGGFDDIIANDLPSGSQVIVTIASSDKAFSTERCGVWIKIG